MSDKDWKVVHKEPGSVASQGLAALVGAEADSTYTFENRETGERVEITASSSQSAGEKLSEGGR